MNKPFWEIAIWLLLCIIILSLFGYAVGWKELLYFFEANISAVAIVIAGVATIIAFYFGYHTAHTSAVLRVAAFRQEWINCLRDDLAKLHAIGINPNGDPMNNEEFYEIGTRIELRMNPSDPDYDRLYKAMYNYFESADGGILEKFGNNSEFVEVSQKILKKEWERLKLDVRARKI